MRKILLLPLFIVGSFSCNQEDTLDYRSQNESEINQSESKSAGDGAYDVLGYGYDITEAPFSPDASRFKQIIDVRKMREAEAENPKVQFDDHTISEITYRSFSGETMITYLKDIVEKANIKGTVASNKLDKVLSKGLFSASAKYGKETGKKNTYTSIHSYATVDALKRQRKLFLHSTDPSIYSKYLDAHFIERMRDLTPDKAYKIVEDYGTHILLDITTGGYARVNLRSITTEETNSYTRKQIVEAGGKFGLGSIGFSVDGDWEKTEIEESSKKNKNRESSGLFVGGETNGHTITFDRDGNITSETIGFGTWASSINKNNARLVDADWNHVYPIYAFVTDPVKKQILEDAVLKYIKDKEPEILDLKPLYRLRNDQGHFHHRTNPWINVGERLNEWVNQGIIAFVFDKPQANLNLLPLYLIKNKKGLYYLSCCNESGSLGIHCYTYREATANTKPLTKIYHSKDMNHIYTLEPSFRDEVLYHWRGWQVQNALGNAYSGTMY